jgi:hypothetical protein
MENTIRKTDLDTLLQQVEDGTLKPIPMIVYDYGRLLDRIKTAQDVLELERDNLNYFLTQKGII